MADNGTQLRGGAGEELRAALARKKEYRKSMPKRLPSEAKGLLYTPARTGQQQGAGAGAGSGQQQRAGGSDWRNQTEGGARKKGGVNKWTMTHRQSSAAGTLATSRHRGSTERNGHAGGGGGVNAKTMVPSPHAGRRPAPPTKRFSMDVGRTRPASGGGGGVVVPAKAAAAAAVNRAVLIHDFHKKTFTSPVTCMQCNKIIWGAIRQGYQCRVCKGTCHKKCMHKVKDNCGVDASNIDSVARSAAQKLDITGIQDDIASIEDLIVKMNDPQHGVVLRDHKTTFKVYKDSFLGTELVDWMLNNLRYRTRDECEQFAARLLFEDVIVGTRANTKKFKDDASIYMMGDGAGGAGVVSPLTSPRGSAIAGERGGGGGGGNTPDTLSSVLGGGKASYDDFEYGEMLGKGAFGKVIKVRKKDTGKYYAMKVLWKDKLNTKVLVKGIMAEKKIMMNSSPFLVHLHYAFQTPEKLFMCMDYVSGGTIKYHLDKILALPIKVVRFWAAEIVIAVQFLHKCGFIYRDMKPDNLLIDHEGHICLADFGLSKELNHLDSVTSTICGTPCYLAPEVIDGKYKASIDYWGLGVVVYEMISGVNPFEAKTFNEVLKKILHKKVQYPKEIFKDDVTIDFLQRCLARKPADRLQGDAIREHDFFKGINWGQLAMRKVASPFKVKEPINVTKTGARKVKESPHVEHRRVKKEVFGDFSYAANNPY